MSVYKKNRTYYLYDFETGGRRFYGSTKCRTRPEAEAVARAVRTVIRALLAVAGTGQSVRGVEFKPDGSIVVLLREPAQSLRDPEREAWNGKAAADRTEQ